MSTSASRFTTSSTTCTKLTVFLEHKWRRARINVVNCLFSLVKFLEFEIYGWHIFVKNTLKIYENIIFINIITNSIHWCIHCIVSINFENRKSMRQKCIQIIIFCHGYILSMAQASNLQKKNLVKALGGTVYVYVVSFTKHSVTAKRVHAEDLWILENIFFFTLLAFWKIWSRNFRKQ